MWSNAKDIAAGDTVILWLTRDALQPLVVTPGKDINNRFGAYRHSDLIGVPYGSKIASRNGRGFIHVLRPTPELWTLALPHRTQILYVADIAFITAMLGLKPGAKVIEAGTGSGSFSHSVARTIGSSGKLYSFEFHEPRALKAREEFAAHGLSGIIDLSHRNVCKEGFGLVDTVDAVFLDLPAPWDAIPSAKAALKKDRASRICCFSPCMEQVLRTVSALNEASFSEVAMYETLVRPLDVSQTSLQSVETVADRLKHGEVKKEARRLKQIETARAGQKRKRARASDSPAGDLEDGPSGHVEQTEEMPAVQMVKEPVASTPASDRASPQKVIVSKPLQEVRGHTSYLTFATLLPTGSEEDKLGVHDQPQEQSGTKSTACNGEAKITEGADMPMTGVSQEWEVSLLGAKMS